MYQFEKEVKWFYMGYIAYNEMSGPYQHIKQSVSMVWARITEVSFLVVVSPWDKLT